MDDLHDVRPLALDHAGARAIKPFRVPGRESLEARRDDGGDEALPLRVGDNAAIRLGRAEVERLHRLDAVDVEVDAGAEEKERRDDGATSARDQSTPPPAAAHRRRTAAA